MLYKVIKFWRYSKSAAPVSLGDLRDAKNLIAYSMSQNMKKSPYGQKFPKSARDCRVPYAISANFDADKRK